MGLPSTDETGVDRIEVSIDGAPFERYKQPVTLSAYKDYRVKFRAIDVLDNPSPEFDVQLSGEWVPRGDVPEFMPILR